MKSYLSYIHLLIFLLVGLTFVAGCSPVPLPASTVTPQPILPSPTTTAVPPESVLYLDPSVPAFYLDSIQIPPEWTLTTDREAANIAITISAKQPQTQLVYALAAPSTLSKTAFPVQIYKPSGKGTRRPIPLCKTSWFRVPPSMLLKRSWDLPLKM